MTLVLFLGVLFVGILAGLPVAFALLLSSMALMPMPDSPLPPVLVAPETVGVGCEICSAGRDTAPSSTGVSPGETWAAPLPPVLLTAASKTDPSCVARSLAFMYFTS